MDGGTDRRRGGARGGGGGGTGGDAGGGCARVAERSQFHRGDAETLSKTKEGEERAQRQQRSQRQKTLRVWGGDLIGDRCGGRGYRMNLRTFAVRCPAASDSSYFCESGLDTG